MAGSETAAWFGSVNGDRPSSHVVREDSGPPSLASGRTRPAISTDQSPFAMLANSVQ